MIVLGIFIGFIAALVLVLALALCTPQIAAPESKEDDATKEKEHAARLDAISEEGYRQRRAFADAYIASVSHTDAEWKALRDEYNEMMHERSEPNDTR